ncbi:MAG: hypothetical protein ABIU54_04190 [Candidatus Eisenbacteria bacterium]
MNRTLMTTFLRQRATSPMRLMLLMFMFGGPILLAILTRSLAPLAGGAANIVLVFVAGAIGQEVSSGVLQLTFARPVSRPSYVVSRWLAASLATTLLVLMQVLLVTMVLLLRGIPVSAAEAARIVLEGAAMALAGAAVVLALSAFVNGLGDLGVLLLCFISAQVLSMISGQMHWDAVDTVARAILETLFPKLDLRWLFGRGVIPWAQLASWSSTLTLGLGVAIWRLNHRELSYAAD